MLPNMSAVLVIALTLSFLVSLTTGTPDKYTCKEQSKSDDGGNLLQKVVSLNYCLLEDPVPPTVLAPSRLSAYPLLKKSGGAPVFFHLERGQYIYADGVYLGSIFVYPRDECRVSSKERSSTCNQYPNGAIMVDCPPTSGPTFGTLVRKFLATRKAVLQVLIITHEHYDHMGNYDSVVNANPSLNYFITSKEVANTLREYATTTFSNSRVDQIYRENLNYPKSFKWDLEVSASLHATFTRGNQTLRITSGEGHTPGDLLVWHAATGTLINVDALVFPKYSPFFNLAEGTDLPGLFKNFDRYRTYPFKYFISGHFNRVGTPDDVNVAEQYMVDILDAAYRASTSANGLTSKSNFYNIAKNVVKVFSGPNEANWNLVFNEYLNQVTLHCVDIVLDSDLNLSKKVWIKELGSVRTTVYSHCKSLAESLRIQLPGIS